MRGEIINEHQRLSSEDQKAFRRWLSALSIVGLSLAFSTVPSSAQEFTVCEVEYIEDCHHAVDTHIPCGTIEEAAEALCQRAGRSGENVHYKIDDSEDGACGAAVWRVSCS